MYDKSGLVLRVETVINNPEEFRVRKQVLRQGKMTSEWVSMRKGVAYLFRYCDSLLRGFATSKQSVFGGAGGCRQSHRRETRAGARDDAQTGRGGAPLRRL